MKDWTFNERLFLDCDNVLADFTSAALRVSQTSITVDQVVDYDLLHVLGREAWDRVVKEADRAEFWESLEPCPGAVEAYRYLRMVFGPHVYVVTAPWWSCREWMGARFSWLLRHFGIRYQDVVIASPKHVIGDGIMVEDRPDTLERWVKGSGHRRPVLIRQPYNTAHHDRFPSYTGLDHLARVVSEEVEARRLDGGIGLAQVPR